MPAIPVVPRSERDHHRAVEREMVRQLLATWDPREEDYHLTYPGLLRRLMAVLATQLVEAEQAQAEEYARG